MPKKKTQEEFIAEATAAHNNKYDYSKVAYEGNKVKVKIICPEHGEFTQIPKDHIRGKGCKQCGIQKNREQGKDTLEVFVKKAVEKHGDTYDYSRVVYKNSKTPVEIICKKHGSFQQTPNVHLGKSGCPECGQIALSTSQRYSKEQFIENALKTHGNKYDYSKVDYQGSSKKVTIICPVHGEFIQEANRHVQGSGCKECNKLKTTNREKCANGWGYSRWAELGAKSPSFDSYKVYVIKCYCEETKEEFMKIGKTYRTVHNRYRECHIPYGWELLKEIKGDAREMSILERDIQQRLKMEGMKYKPTKKFDGMHECFTVDTLDIIEEVMDEK